MTKHLKLYGERNTNTNYLSRLVRLNLRVREVPGVVPPVLAAAGRALPGDEWLRDLYFALTYPKNLGWKHRRVGERELVRYGRAAANVAFVTLTKNPYSWLLSLYRRPYHRPAPDLGFEAFLRRPWRTVGRDNAPRTLESPVELWNLKNASYLRLPQADTLHLTTESLFENPENVIRQLSRRFALERTSSTFTDYERSTKDAGKNGDYYRDYYLNERWRRDLTDAAVMAINGAVDRQLMARFGYELLT